MWLDLSIAVFGHKNDLMMSSFSGLFEPTYRIQDTGDRSTGDDGGPDDTIRCRQVIEQDGRSRRKRRPYV
jgi:hypothetical protein